MEEESSTLKAQWLEVFKKEPPARASREFMQGHLAWVKQAVEYGGLKRKTNTQLKHLMKQLRDGVELIPDHNLIIKPGTRLIRQYQGIKHEVITTDNGFRYKDKIYGSLSMIAREITGTRWNGKVFFGAKE